MAPHAQTPDPDLPDLRALGTTHRAAAGAPMAPAMQLALDANFGSVERWHEAFTACALAPGVGPGWALLVFQPDAGTLVNRRVVADAGPGGATGTPILAVERPVQVDTADDPLAARTRIGECLRRIDWASVYQRYQQAVHAASEALGADPHEVGAASLLDVRRAGVFVEASTVLPGARWCDPATVAAWAAELPVQREWVVYCVHGHEVSRATALRLRAAGLNARYLRGGLHGWQAAGRPIADKSAGSTS